MNLNLNLSKRIKILQYVAIGLMLATTFCAAKDLRKLPYFTLK